MKILNVKRSELIVPSIRFLTERRLAHTHRNRRQHE